MNCKDVKYYLDDYAKGYLLDEMRAEIHKHLNSCKSCTKIFDEIITSKSKEKIKKQKQAEKKVNKDAVKENKNSIKKHQSKVSLGKLPATFESDYKKINHLLNLNEIDNNKLFFIAGVISAIGLGIVLAFLIFDFSPNTYWFVEKLSGYPTIESRVLVDKGIIKIGETLNTDSYSRARLKVESIGEIDVEPRTEIQINETESFEYNLILYKGSISARTWSSPKLFAIKTPAANIKDLGCVYNISVDEKFTTMLQVKSGWVLMENGKQKCLLPAGTSCYSDTSIGLGTPFSDNASELFRQALFTFDFKDSTKKIETVLSESEKDDFISLFHLLLKTDKETKEKIFDRLAQLTNIPKQIRKELIVDGDKYTLARLWIELNLGSITDFQNL